MNNKILSIILAIFLSNILFAQNLTLPRQSPKASVSQTVGLTDIQIDYSRPAVRERKIWGELVPYGYVNPGFGGGNSAPWRAGANENTTIEFSTDVFINGKKIKAGKYGLFVLVEENNWTFILSSDNQAWGNYFYDKNNDVVKIQVAPEKSEHMEWLQYSYQNITQNSVYVKLHWEKLSAEFKIETNTVENVITSMKKELTGLLGFGWQAHFQYASYCIQNNTNLDEAEKSIKLSISLNRNFANLNIYSRLLTINGKVEEAENLMTEAIEIANEQELNQYGYFLMNNNDFTRAIEIFQLNIERNPDSWNVYDSLGDAYDRNNNKKEAKINYQKALDLAPSNQKERIQGIINRL